MPLLHCLVSYSFVVTFEIRKCEPSTFFPPRLFWLIWVPHSPLLILRSTCEFLPKKKKKASWNFGSDCIESIDQFWEYCRFNSIKCFSLWTWNILIYLGLLEFLSIIFYTFKFMCLAHCLLTVFLSILFFLMLFFIANLWKYNWFLCVDLVPCNFAELIY